MMCASRGTSDFAGSAAWSDVERPDSELMMIERVRYDLELERYRYSKAISLGPLAGLSKCCICFYVLASLAG